MVSEQLEERWQHQTKAEKDARHAIYWGTLDWWKKEYCAAVLPYDAKAELACHIRAAKEWTAVTGLPPLDVGNAVGWNAALTAAGRTDKIGYVPGREAINAVLAWAQVKFSEVQYSVPRSPDQWELLFDCSWRTIKRRIDAGDILAREVNSKSWKIRLSDIPQVATT